MSRFEMAAKQPGAPEDEAAEAVAPQPARGPGLAELDELIASGQATPQAVAATLAGHPAEHEAMIAPLHARMGNGFVAEVLAAVQAPETLIGAPVAGDDVEAEPATADTEPVTEDPPIPPPGVEPDRSFVIRNLIVTGHLPEDMRVDAEGFNRANIPNVVKFDRATQGNNAKINGELDADRVAMFQLHHGLEPTGKVDNDTVALAQKSAPRPGPGPGPQPGPRPGPDPDPDPGPGPQPNPFDPDVDPNSPAELLRRFLELFHNNDGC